VNAVITVAILAIGALLLGYSIGALVRAKKAKTPVLHHVVALIAGGIIVELSIVQLATG